MSNEKLFQLGNVHGNVDLSSRNFSGNEFCSYAGQFKEAARVLTKNINTSSMYNDLDACPIVFLYRHSLELYSKAIALYGQDILSMARKPVFSKEEVLNSNHNLEKLFNYVFEIFEKVFMREWPPDIDGVPSLSELKSIITEFSKIDNNSFAFRYPTDKKFKPSKPTSFRFNILNFSSIIEQLCNFLEGCCFELSEIMQNLGECIAEHEYEFP